MSEWTSKTGATNVIKKLGDINCITYNFVKKLPDLKNTKSKNLKTVVTNVSSAFTVFFLNQWTSKFLKHARFLGALGMTRTSQEYFLCPLFKEQVFCPFYQLYNW